MFRRMLAIITVLLVAIPAVAGTWTPNNFIYKPSPGARGEGEKKTFDTGLDRIDARLGKEIWVGDPGSGTTLQDAVTAIGSNKAMLRIPAGTWSIGANFTIPANVTVKPERGAILSIADAKILTINGSFEAGLYQIFSCTGTGKVVFAEPGNIQMSWFNDNLAKAVASAPAGATILAEAKTYAATSLSISTANLTIKGVKGKTIFAWATLGAGINGIAVTANGFTMDGLHLRGPSAATYVAGEQLLNVQGTSTSVRLDGLTVRDCEFSQAGSNGLRAQFVDHILVENNYFHDLGYIGAGFVSCNQGTFRNNRIKTITPGTSSNMYGVTLTHDSTNYNLDPNAGTPLAAQPFCNDWVVESNFVEGVNWQGIDTHGVYNLRVANNAVFACKNGISVTSGSGAAVNYAGWQNTITGNVVDASNRDGTLSGRENTGFGLTLEGGATVPHSRFTCVGNVVRGYGLVNSSTAGAIRLANSYNKAVIANNVIDNWGGVGLYISGVVKGAVVSGNVFGDLAAPLTDLGGTESRGYCIYVSGAGAKSINIVGNTHDYLTNQAREGVDIGSTVPSRLGISGNDFSKVYGTAISAAGTQLLGMDLTPVVEVTNTIGSLTVDLAAVTKGPANAAIIVKCFGLTGNITITDLQNSHKGQVVRIINEDTTYSVTVNRTNAYLQGGVNWVGNRYDILILTKSDSNSSWYEIGRSGDNM